MRALVVLCLVLAASPAIAQEPRPSPEKAPAIDASKMGVDLKRISKGLRIAESREKASVDGLRLDFNVQVYGQAPKIDVLNGIDLFNGPVPGTAPSHRQMIDFWTPEIYRAPAMPVSALAFWAVNQVYQKSKKARCEEEIANYRALIMQGVNVAAPRCTQ